VGAERLRGQMEGVKEMAAGMTAFAVGDWLKEQVSGYLEGARGAQALATSMNASVEEGGRLAVIFQSMGLEADDLLEIQAQFASTSKDGLTAAGNELKTNRDGTVNWARSLEDALAQLQQIPDATERNRQGFQMFGEEGYKQLSRLLTSGVSVEEAFERVGTRSPTRMCVLRRNSTGTWRSCRCRRRIWGAAWPGTCCPSWSVSWTG
jgi:hypothetical protein